MEPRNCLLLFFQQNILLDDRSSVPEKQEKQSAKQDLVFLLNSKEQFLNGTEQTSVKYCM